MRSPNFQAKNKASHVGAGSVLSPVFGSKIFKARLQRLPEEVTPCWLSGSARARMSL